MRVSSYRSFPVYGAYGVRADMLAQFSQLPVTSNVSEWGFGIASGTTAPTDGAFFRYDSGGLFKCVVNNNGTEATSGALNATTLVSTNNAQYFTVEVLTTMCRFWIDNVLVAEVDRPVANGSVTASQNLPIFFRTYNSSATGAAQVMKVGQVTAHIEDMHTSKPYSHIVAGMGGGCYQGQTGGTMGSTAQMAFNTAPTSFTPTSTTAPAGSTGLGGLFNPGVASLAVATDYIIQSYQVPAGTAALPGKSLYLTGVRINTVNLGAASGGALVFVWALQFGSTGVAPNGTEGATVKAGRRVVIGQQSLASAAAIGTVASPDLYMSFTTPILVQPGEYVQTIMRFWSYTTAASETFGVSIAFDGYWE